jgi:hypothetical protein
MRAGCFSSRFSSKQRLPAVQPETRLKAAELNAFATAKQSEAN